MASPTVQTIKRLFAVSGNRCAFPKCNTPLVDAASGKVTGRICHIKARQPGGPRYDVSQTEEDRHGSGNLFLLCPIHHDVVDDDTESYTVERLTQIKAAHEAANARGQEPSDAIAQQLIANISGTTITHGSIIFTQNQMGGQVAHSITNVGPQPRQVSHGAANALVAELRRLSPETVDLSSILGDPEGYQLASVLKQVLELGGWKVDGVNQAVYTDLPKGVIIETPSVRPSLEILLNWCGAADLKPQGYLNPNANRVRIIVGANL
ncbi:MAG: hypothetical protein MUP52_13880 [Candidatus Aminicenantes bacterium]|nr:hypothetical protein [Candidatus Aminicenantes bacterium]